MELFSRFSSILTFLSGAKRRIGFYNYQGEGLYRGRYLTHRVTYNVHMHMSQNFMALIESLSEDTIDEPLVKREIPPSSLDQRLWFSPDESLKIKIHERLKKGYPFWDPSVNKLFILNPSPGDLLPIRGWPLEYFGQLAQALLDAGPHHLVVLLGLSKVRSDGDFIKKKVESSRCINLIGQTEDLKEMITLFSFGDALITSDGGPAHFASMTDIKVVVLFGPETPRLYAPLGSQVHVLYKAFSCSPCVNVLNHRKTPCSDNRCLKAISVEQVVSVVLKE
ncbi:MAG: glycosyltransferase family 9 protein [Nitrospinae bacterium]|nr:glycosyltransferase family 9 protein [Nitrospinota bacterium]